MGAVFLQVLSTLRENTSRVVAVFTRTMPVKTWRRSARDSYLKPETGRLICRLEQIARRLAVTPPPLDKPLRDWPRNLLVQPPVTQVQSCHCWDEVKVSKGSKQ